VLLDGLSPTNAYQFRLRFTRGVDAQDEQLGIDVLGDDTVRLGQPTGPLLTDGNALTSLMAPTASPLQPVPTSSSSAALPWAEGSVCRPGLHFAVRVLHNTHGPLGSLDIDETLASAPLLQPSDVSVEDGALTLKRLRCPRGCRLSISPTGLMGFARPPRVTRSLETPLLAPIPENACRLEVRFRRRAVMLSDEKLGQTLAEEVCAGLHCQPEQLRLIEQRLGGEYVIFDLLSHSTAKAHVQYLCDAFAAATRLECYAPTPSAHHASAAAGKTHASVVTTCKAARSIFASDFMSSFDPRGGVLQLKDEGHDVELASWLTSDEGADGGGGGLAELVGLLVQLGLAIGLLGALLTAAYSARKHGALRADTFAADAKVVLRDLRRRARAFAAVVSKHALRIPAVAQAGAALGVASRVAKARAAALMDATPLRHVASEWYQAVLPADVETADLDDDDVSSVGSRGAGSYTANREPRQSHEARAAAAAISPSRSPTRPAAASDGMVDVSLGSPKGESATPRHLELRAMITLAGAYHAEVQSGKGEGGKAEDSVAGVEEGDDNEAEGAVQGALFSRFWGAANTLGSVFGAVDDGKGSSPRGPGASGGDTPRGSQRAGSVLQRVSFETIEGEAVETTIGVVPGEDTYPQIERRLQQLGAQILPRSMLGAHAEGHGTLLLSMQYFDAESGAIVEAEPKSVMEEMLKASSWRVLVLG